MKSGLYIHVCFFPYWLKKNKAENVNKRRKEIVNGYIWVNEHQIVHKNNHESTHKGITSIMLLIYI